MVWRAIFGGGGAIGAGTGWEHAVALSVSSATNPRVRQNVTPPSYLNSGLRQNHCACLKARSASNHKKSPSLLDWGAVWVRRRLGTCETVGHTAKDVGDLRTQDCENCN